MLSETVLVDSYFPPDDGPDALARIITEIDKAQTSIYGIIYALTHPDIVAALCRAMARSATLYLILDMTEAHGPELTQLHVLFLAGLQPSNACIGTSERHSLIHDKVWVIDQAVVMDGSLNYSPSGLKQDQNFDVWQSSARAQQYTRQYDRLRQFIVETEPQYAKLLAPAEVGSQAA